MTVLLFLAMIIIFLGIDFVVQRKKKTVPAAAQAQRTPLPLRVPSGIFFAPSHTWLSLFPSGNVRIGADDFVLRMMKNPNVSFLKIPGSFAKKGEALFQLKEGSKTLTVHSPIDGEVVTLNEDLQTASRKDERRALQQRLGLYDETSPGIRSYATIAWRTKLGVDPAGTRTTAGFHRRCNAGRITRPRTASRWRHAGRRLAQRL